MAKHVKAFGAVAVTAGLGLAFTAFRVGQARSGLAELLLWLPPDIDPSERARHMANAASRILLTLHVAAPVFAGTSILVSLALGFMGGPSVGRRLAALGTLVFALTAAVAWASNRELFAGGHGCGAPCLYDALLRSQRWETLGKLGVLVSAALCWLLLMARAYSDAKRLQAASGRTLVAGTLLLLLGGSAFAATRAHHWDALHPMPPDAANASTHACFSDAAHLAALPPARPDCVAVEAQVVEVTPHGVVLDGYDVPEPAELGRLLKEKRQLWQMLNPDSAFSGVLLVAAPRAATTQQLLPWLAAAERAGFPKLGVYLQAPPLRFDSKTLGVVTKLRCCSRVWQVDAAATTSLTSWPTWGELAGAAMQPEHKLALR